MSGPYTYSEASLANLEQAHEHIQTVCHQVIEEVDVRIGETHRTKTKHQAYLEADPPLTKVPYSKTMHRYLPSRAVHIIPYPEGWQAPRERWYYVGGIVVGMAHLLLPPAVRWRWGGDWDGDDIFSDQAFDDLAHHEIILPEDPDV